MTGRQRDIRQSFMQASATVAVCILVISALTGCREEHKELISGDTDFEKTPTMTTTKVETLISDSGIIRYRILAPLWYMFDEASEPRWTFPKGLTLERYDDYYNKNATILCDSAIYHKTKALWELDGNVRVTNTLGEKFMTDQLFWNEREGSVYSDSFIHIERSDRVLEGYGFTANDRMTKYTIRDVSGIFPVEGLRGKATEADTTAAAPAPPVPPAPDAAQP